MIQVWEENGLRVGWFDMLSRAAVAVTAGADLVVEGAVDFVGFSAEDRGKVVGHLGGYKRFARGFEDAILRAGRMESYGLEINGSRSCSQV